MKLFNAKDGTLQTLLFRIIKGVFFILVKIGSVWYGSQYIYCRTWQLDKGMIGSTKSHSLPIEDELMCIHISRNILDSYLNFNRLQGIEENLLLL